MRIRQKGNIFSSYGSIICLIFIWAFAFLLSSPLFFFNAYKPLLLNFDLSSSDMSSDQSDDASDVAAAAITAVDSTVNDQRQQHTSTTTNDNDNEIFLSNEHLLTHINVAHCIENSPFQQSRLIYSYTSLIIQYVLPILIVGTAYGSIWWKLKKQRDKLKSHNQIQQTVLKSSQFYSIFIGSENPNDLIMFIINFLQFNIFVT